MNMVIVIQCTDQVGLVAKISGLLADESYNILSMHEHVDKAENLFFMRLEVNKQSEASVLEEKLRELLPEGALIKVNPDPVKKVIVMVTKEYHCLADILIRNYFKTLGATVQCVIGNYTNLEDICNRFDVPFHHVPYEGPHPESEQRVLNIIIRLCRSGQVYAHFIA
jgi:formyltetrahydrofolate deformylase